MIRITELSLPWGDPTETRTQDALRRAILKRLTLREPDLLDFTVFKRSHDARRKDREIAFVYIVDVAVRDEARGFSLHAGLAIQPGERAKLERLCRYVSRPPVATARLALVPPPRMHLKRCHGVFAPHSKLRAAIAARAPPRQGGLL